jgi:nuclear pore complex protein Nup50
VIISAKRRIGGSSTSAIAHVTSAAEENEAPKSVFSGFAGFGKSTFGSASTGSTFSFLKTTPTETKEPSNTKTTDIGVTSHSGLADLNKAFLSWIQTCLTKNADCILVPIFKDYEKYVEDFKKGDGQKEKSLFASPVSNATPPTFGQAAASSTLTTSLPSSTAFGSVPGNFILFSSVLLKKILITFLFLAFSFGTSTGFSMTKSTPSFFGNVSKPSISTTVAASSENGGADDDEDTPPKVEFTPVIEKDSVYSTRCKVFVKKDGDFGDRGVGTLFVKKVQVADKDKYQLIVRADTSLGNLLMNVLLSDAVPTQRLGKNNVMLVCAPKADEAASSVLLRVKTESDADNLLKEIEKYKK